MRQFALAKNSRRGAHSFYKYTDALIELHKIRFPKVALDMIINMIFASENPHGLF
jgi:hypothetical protein